MLCTSKLYVLVYSLLQGLVVCFPRQRVFKVKCPAETSSGRFTARFAPHIPDYLYSVGSQTQEKPKSLFFLKRLSETLCKLLILYLFLLLLCQVSPAVQACLMLGLYSHSEASTGVPFNILASCNVVLV